MRPRLAGTLLWGAAATLAGCVGIVGDPGAAPDSGGTQAALDGGGSVVPDYGTGRSLTRAAQLRRLTASQLEHSLRDLLGTSGAPSEPLPDLVSRPGDVFGAVQGSSEVFHTADVEVVDRVVGAAATAAVSTSSRRRSVLGCDPATASDPCIATFFAQFTRRAFRRAVTDAESGRYVDLTRATAAALGSVPAGLQYGIEAVLDSPNFLYLVEVGEPDPARAGRRRYTDYELAARLAYFFWDAPPDDALLDAADRGALTTDAGLRAQVERLGSDAGRMRPAVQHFVSELFDLAALDGLQRDPTAFPGFTAALPAAMRGEIERVALDALLDQGGDVRGLFTTRTTFVNDPLARLYGLTTTAGSQFVRAELPADGPRTGVLTRAGLLAQHDGQAESSPTKRGRFVLDHLLCLSIPPPPANANRVVPDDPSLTRRERLERHTSGSPCAGCHRQMDPIGFGLEAFDAVGAYRTTLEGRPIDTSGTLGDRPFRDARELSAMLATDARVPGCFARQLFRHGAGRYELADEGAALGGAATTLAASTLRLIDLMKAVALSDAFRSFSTP